MAVAPEFPFAEISPWVREPDDRQPALDADLRTDVVIIGAGYTGLSAALSLREQGLDVAVLERDFAGSGASGRNAGHLTPTIGKDIPTLLRLFGRERSTRLVRFADAAVEHTEEVFRKYGIDCEYAPTGNVMAGLHPKHDGRLRKAADAARRLGAEVRFLSEGEMRERGIPPAFRCGVLEGRGGTLHPGRYVMGLRSAALAAGVRLFERSALVEMSPGAPVTARTAGGSVTADFAILATNAYTSDTGCQRRTVTPLRVSLFETDPIGASQLADLAWPGREGIYTAHEALESYRITPRGTIVGGSKVVRYEFGSRLAAGYDPAAFRIIEGAFRERFPETGDVRVASFWGGWIGLTFDFLPRLGTVRDHRNVLYGVGFCGHGVAQATLMGAMLCERVQGRVHEWEAALDRRAFDWPPEPLRYLGAKLLNGVVMAMDRRTDRQIRAARRA